MDRKAYRAPIQDWAQYQTFVNSDSKSGITPPEDNTTNKDTKWPVSPQRSKEKDRPLPLPSDLPKNRQKNIGPFQYSKPKKPARTPGESGESRGHPTKYDYNYPTRRSLKAVENPGSSSYVKRPSQKQKHQKGPSKVKSRQEYLHNRSKLRPKNRKKWLKDRRNPKKKRKRDYYEKHPERYKRKGFSPFTTPAERTKAWRKKNKEGAMWPADWNTLTKKTEAPEGTETNSLRVPRLRDRPQPGLSRNEVFPEGGMPEKNRVQDQTNGSGKVIPRDTDLLNKKRVYKDSIVASKRGNMRERILRIASKDPEFRRSLILKLAARPKSDHKPGDVWNTPKGDFRAMNQKGVPKTFKDQES